MVDVTKLDLSEYIEKAKEGVNDTEPTTITLEPWEEISGFFFGLREDDQCLYVCFERNRLAVPLNSYQSQCLRDSLEGMGGQQISIVRTESLEQPYRIQTSIF